MKQAWRLEYERMHDTKFAKLFPNHIYHSHSKDMAEKLEVAVLDVLHKNEASHMDMLDIMKE